MRLILIALWAVLIGAVSLHAQVADDDVFVEEEPIQILDESSRLDEISDLFPAGDFPQGAVPFGFEPSDEARAAIDAYAVGYYENLTRGLSHRQKVFDWQYTSSVIIFYVVIGIVLIGLYFSWMQFHRKDGEVGETTMEASKEGFKVSSPVLGVIILLLSLAFFYLYLLHVYPISELG